MSIGKILGRAVKAPRSLLGSGPGKRVHWSHDRSPEILHSQVTPAATYSPWLCDAAFQTAYQRVRKSTLLDIYRCYELWDLAKQSNRVDGVILEVGVYRGGSGCLLALAAAQKTVYLADTFAGVVHAGPRDTRYLGGEHSDTSEERVRALLDSAGAKNARLLKGIFPGETAASIPGPIALLHVDVDVYQSAKDTVEWALPRLLPGAVMVFDDFGFDGCEGITRYVHELREQLKGFVFLHNLNGHAVLVKTVEAHAET